MSLYENWMRKAFSQEGHSVDGVWNEYLPKEQKIYEHVLENKVTKLEGKVSELAERFDMTAEQIVAFVDGINASLPTAYDMPTLTEDSDLVIEIDFARLFKLMVEYKAEHLYSLPQWDNIFDAAARKQLPLEQKRSRTIVKEEKIK